MSAETPFEVGDIVEPIEPVRSVYSGRLYRVAAVISSGSVSLIRVGGGGTVERVAAQYFRHAEPLVSAILKNQERKP